MANTFNLNSILQPQAAMSAADNEWGMSLPETTYEDTPLVMQTSGLENLPDAEEEPQFSAIDAVNPMQPAVTSLALSMPNTDKTDLSGAIDKLFAGTEALKGKAYGELYTGAIFKTIGAASNFFSRATGLLAGQTGTIKGMASNAQQSYQNQMDSLDNQVLYLKNQLADRFNKTVETNIMNMAAKNLRVSSGNVLELSKEQAQEITEDIRMTESNARLKQIALEAGKKATAESSKYAIKQMWTGLIGSAASLGLMISSGGGTGESWGDLYAGYQKSKAIKSSLLGKDLTLNSVYKG